MEPGTVGLREEARSWSLAGDRDLLAILQRMHQKVLEKAEATSSLVEEMMSSVDKANVSLQNVNNSFLALSNTQFIESRVYDDDTDMVVDTQLDKEPPMEKTYSMRSDIDHSLLTLQQLFEEVTILPDTDSETDSDTGDLTHSVVLKAKDLYSSRPLPHVIGSVGFRSKWHAGLLESDSESEQPSGTREPYSTEEEDNIGHQEHESFTSDEEITSRPQPDPPMTTQQTQSDFAAELARRLGQTEGRGEGQTEGRGEGQTEGRGEGQTEGRGEGPGEGRGEGPGERRRTRNGRHMFSEQVQRLGVSGNIYSDEPPPLEQVTDDEEDHQYEGGDIFDDFANNVPNKLLTDTLIDEHRNIGRSEAGNGGERSESATGQDSKGAVKKPAGAISLFGSKSGAEDIGAAILKRNQRQSASSDDGHNPYSHTTDRRPETPPEVDDVFDDLFAKSERIAENKKVILNDDIFDDIDDIFSTDIVSKVPVKDLVVTKTIFDDDDDDLFADIDFEPVKNTRNLPKVTPIEKEVDLNENRRQNNKVYEVDDYKAFDDEGVDDLFSDMKVSKTVNIEKTKSKSLFEESDEELFTNIKDITNNNLNDNNKSIDIEQGAEDKSEIINNNLEQIQQSDLLVSKTSNSTTSMKKQSLFDYDDEVDNLFSNSLTKSEKLENVFETPIDIKNVNIIENRSKINEDKITIASTGDVHNDHKENTITRKSDNKDIHQTNINDDTESEIKDTMKNTDNILNKQEINMIEAEPDTVLSVINNEPKCNTDDISTEQNDLGAADLEEEDSLFHQPDNDSMITPEKLDYDTKNEKYVDSCDTQTAFSRTKSTDSNDNFNVYNDNEIDQKKNETINDALFYTNNSILSNTVDRDDFDDIFKIPKEVNKDNDISNVKTDFDSIFNDLPPEFEKSKETKKSKNVNALFDDDSDDEALFFKKNDHLEEKPEEFLINSDESQPFGLFHNEPPDISMDFSEHDDLFGGISDKNVTLTDKAQRSDTTKIKYILEDADIFQDTSEYSITTPTKPEIPIEIANITKVNVKDIDRIESHADNVTKDVQRTEYKKTIGKIKSNININVRGLLPGASPKKIVKHIESTDVNIENADLNTSTETKVNKPSDNIRSDIRTDIQASLKKSASFEEDPESPLLCNKISKERAKIQVKRRPSSRKARRDAIIKSKTDTDLVKNDKHVTNEGRAQTEAGSGINTLGRVYTDVLSEKDSTIERISKSENLIRNRSDELIVNERENITKSIYNEKDNEPEQLVEDDDDDDIFKDFTKTNAIMEEKPQSSVKTVKKKQIQIEDSNDDDDDIFKTFSPKPTNEIDKSAVGKFISEEIGKNTSTPERENIIEKPIKDTSKQHNTESIFGESSHEELFGVRKPKNNEDVVSRGEKHIKSEKSVPRTTLFGEDSDEELFSKTTTTKVKSAPRVSVQSTQSTPATEVVFQDPLSMFGSDGQE